MVAFLLLLYMGSAPEDRLRAAAVVLVFFICPRLFLFDPRPVSLSAPGFITVFSVPAFLPISLFALLNLGLFSARMVQSRVGA
jgi:hypothetical protein